MIDINAVGGFDTETDRGQAVLISWDTDAGNEAALCSGWSLRDVFERVLSKKRYWYAHNLGYDVFSLCHPERIGYEKAARVLSGLPEDVDGVRVTWSAPWRLRLCLGRQRVDCHDLWRLFQYSLDKAAAKYLSEAMRKLKPPVSDWRQVGPILRGEHGPEASDSMFAYAKLDARIVRALWGVLHGSLVAAGIDMPRPPASPASLSRHLWRGDLKREANCPFQRYWRLAYFGGRVECAGVGAINDASVWDIHSAYPSAAAKLKSVVGAVFGGWSKRPLTSSIDYAAVEVSYNAPASLWGPLAVRDAEGGVSYPTGASTTWCGLAGLRLLDDLQIPYTVRRGYWVVCRPDATAPFRNIEEYFRLRKSSAAAGQALKLALNALYGILAETLKIKTDVSEIGDLVFSSESEATAANTNFLYAATITEEIRCRMYREAIMTGSAASVMTDGVILRSNTVPNGKIGDGLGDWGVTTLESGEPATGLTGVWGNGRYRVGGYRRFRGLREWPDQIGDPVRLREGASPFSLEVLDDRRVGLRRWLATGGLEMLNDISPEPVVIGLADPRRTFAERPTWVGCLTRWYESTPKDWITERSDVVEKKT